MKRATLIGALMAAVTTAPMAANAQAEPTLEQRREAQMAYSRAQALRAGTQHSEAAALFETADRLAPSVQALGNAIRAHKDCRTPDHDARAATLALRLQVRYGNDPRYSSFAEQVINELRASLVRVTVTCEGCEAEADGSLQPGTEFFVPPGNHRIVAHWPGGRSREHRMNNARAGVAENVTLQAPPEVRPAGNTGVDPNANTGASGATGASGSAGTAGASSGASGASGTTSGGTSGTVAGGTSGNGPSGSSGTGTSGDPGASGASGTSGTSGDGTGTGENNGGSTADPGAGLVRPPPSRGGLHPAIFITTAVLAAGAGGVLAWSGIDTLNGVPAYQMAAQQGDRAQAEALLADGQGRELRTNILIGVTSGLGAAAVGTLIFTRWGAPRSEQAPTAMLVPVFGPLPSVALWGRF